MREWLKQRPWFWIVAFLIVMAMANGVLVYLSVRNIPLPA